MLVRHLHSNSLLPSFHTAPLKEVLERERVVLHLFEMKITTSVIWTHPHGKSVSFSLVFLFSPLFLLIYLYGTSSSYWNVTQLHCNILDEMFGIEREIQMSLHSCPQASHFGVISWTWVDFKDIKRSCNNFHKHFNSRVYQGTGKDKTCAQGPLQSCAVPGLPCSVSCSPWESAVLPVLAQSPVSTCT